MGCEKNLKQGQIATIDDLLEQDFSAPKPNEKWVGDITYVWTDESWLFLAVVMDLNILAWWLYAQLAIDALQMALWPRSLLFTRIEVVNIFSKFMD